MENFQENKFLDPVYLTYLRFAFMTHVKINLVHSFTLNVLNELFLSVIIVTLFGQKGTLRLGKVLDWAVITVSGENLNPGSMSQRPFFF